MSSHTNGESEMLACALTFADTAPTPTSVLHVQVYSAPSTPGPDEVVVKMVAAPINPQDFLITAGLYPIKPMHRVKEELVPGYDGVGRVVSVGSQVSDLQPGDMVIPRGQGFGTWRTHALVSATECAKVPRCSDIRFAAMLKMTILPAYFLVEDIAGIRPGDYIVQDAGSSSIAQMVSQFARLKGAHTISVIRDSPDGSKDEKTAKMLESKGADVVCTETEFASNASEILKAKRIVLALDCVWGKMAEALTEHLPPNTKIINFANLSGGGPDAKVALSHKSLFAKSATIVGWKSTSSLATRSNEEMDDLTGWLVRLLDGGTLRMPEYQSVSWALEAGKGAPEGSTEELRQTLMRAVVCAHGSKFREPKVLFEFRK